MLKNQQRILITVTGDFTRGESGSHIRMQEIIEYCLQKFDDVTVYGYTNHPSNPWTDDGRRKFKLKFPKANLILEHESNAMRQLTRLKNFALMVAPHSAQRIFSWKIPGTTPELQKIFHKENNVSALINFVDGAISLHGIDISRSIIETHDVKFIRHAKVRKRSILDISALARLRSEIAVLRAAKGLVAISSVEDGFFRAVIPEVRCFYVPSYATSDDTTPHSIAASPAFPQDIDLLFVGTDNDYNRDGIVQFLRSNKQWISERAIAVAGKVCVDPRLKDLAKEMPRLHLHGYVASLDELYARARAVLAPVDGTGLNIKVLEALAKGKPVFASSHARDALPPGYENCVFPIDRKIIERLLDDSGAKHAAEAEASRFFSSMAMKGERDSLFAVTLE